MVDGKQTTSIIARDKINDEIKVERNLKRLGMNKRSRWLTTRRNERGGEKGNFAFKKAEREGRGRKEGEAESNNARMRINGNKRMRWMRGWGKKKERKKKVVVRYRLCVSLRTDKREKKRSRKKRES